MDDKQFDQQLRDALESLNGPSAEGQWDAFERRLENDEREEFRQALCEIAKIARYRLDAMLRHTD